MSINNFLVVSRASPFSKSGSGEVANQFLSFFSKDEIVFLCEKNNGISVDSEQIHYVNLYPINIRRGKRFIRWQRWFLLPSLVNKIVSLAIIFLLTSTILIEVSSQLLSIPKIFILLFYIIN